LNCLLINNFFNFLDFFTQNPSNLKGVELQKSNENSKKNQEIQINLPDEDSTQIYGLMAILIIISFLNLLALSILAFYLVQRLKRYKKALQDFNNRNLSLQKYWQVSSSQDTSISTLIDPEYFL
jgi:hypothetical protein